MMATRYSFEVSEHRYCDHRHQTIGAAVDCALKLCGKSAPRISPGQFVAMDQRNVFRRLDPDENFVLTLALQDRNLM